MKKLVIVLTLLFLCTMVGFTTSKSTASAKISISKIRRQCSTPSKARKYMKKITFKVWDYRGKKKVTKTKSIYVHRLVAKKYKRAFEKIYKGKEKFPIHDVGGFDWRGSTKSLHSLGLAVDINSNENYLIDGGKIMAGSLWKPKKNPYSIPKNGDVVKAMRKCGFKQCIWGHRKDYMHFSIGGY